MSTMTTLQNMVRIFSSSPREYFSENNPGIPTPRKRGTDRGRSGVLHVHYPRKFISGFL